MRELELLGRATRVRRLPDDEDLEDLQGVEETEEPRSHRRPRDFSSCRGQSVRPSAHELAERDTSPPDARRSRSTHELAKRYTSPPDARRSRSATNATVASVRLGGSSDYARGSVGNEALTARALPSMRRG